MPTLSVLSSLSRQYNIYQISVPALEDKLIYEEQYHIWHSSCSELAICKFSACGNLQSTSDSVHLLESHTGDLICDTMGTNSPASFNYSSSFKWSDC